MTLWQTKGFKPLCFGIFLNAFIDLGHKITIQNTIFKLYDGSEQIWLTAVVNALILLPYILFFAPSGMASDRFAKANVLKFTSISTILLTLGLAICYWQGAFWPAFAMTFLLAIQSAFFGPAKLGFLKELVTQKQLSKANGAAQALTTLGILLGTLVFSIAFETRFNKNLNDATSILSQMLPLAIGLICLALVQAAVLLLLPQTQKTKLETKPANGPAAIKRLYQTSVFWPIVIGMTAFWCIGQMLLATYPAFAKDNMGITNTVVIQGLLSMIAIGIMLGSALAGILSKQAVELGLLPISAFIIIACLVAIPLTTVQWLAWPLFLATGIAGGLFIVPLMAALQMLSKPSQLGSNLAANNLVQNIAMTSCLILTAIAAFYAIPSQWILSFIIVIALTSLTYLLWRMPHCFSALKHYRYQARIANHGEQNFKPYQRYCFIAKPQTDKALLAKALQRLTPSIIVQNGQSFYNDNGKTAQTIYCDVQQPADNPFKLTLSISDYQK